MGAIDVGITPANKNDYDTFGITIVQKGNPANDTGTLTSIQAWANTNIAGFRAGSFYLTSGTTFVCRDSTVEATINNITAGSTQTFDISADPITINSGDYIGCYFTSGRLEANSPSANDEWWYAGERIDPTDTASFTLTDYDDSLYGTGATPAGGWTHIAKVNGVASAGIAKMNGVAVAAIAKVNGVAV